MIQESILPLNARSKSVQKVETACSYVTTFLYSIRWPKTVTQGCELIGRPEKVPIGDQLETTFEVKWRPYGYCFENNWRPIRRLSIVSSNIGSNILGHRKLSLIFLNLAALSLIFNFYEVCKNQNYNF